MAFWRSTRFAGLRCVVVFASIVIGAGSPAFGASSAADKASIHILDAWARESHKTAKAGAVYFCVVNKGEKADRLLGAASLAAKKVELHTHVMQGDVMRMRPVGESGVRLAPGSSVAFKSGGYHIMLMGLRRPLTAKKSIRLRLKFENHPPIRLLVPIKPKSHSPPACGDPALDGHMQGHGKHDHR